MKKISSVFKSAVVALGAVLTVPLGLVVVATPLSAVAQQDSHEPGEKTLWTCGMHPQILQDEPGTCPICGMDLTPKKVTSTATSAAKTADTNKGQRKILYWVAPMDSSYRSDQPGKSPMGMDLAPVYEDGGSEGVVRIDPVVVQNMGVRTAVVQRKALSRQVRTVGQVVVAEDRLSVVNLRFSGWIERIYVDETGVYVKRGQALFEVYSPELQSAQEELLVALRTSGARSGLASAARKRLELFGLQSWQIDRIIKEKSARPTLAVTAPRAGYVIHKNALHGARVSAGQDLYRIADLSKIWVDAEVYEYDAAFVELGAPVEVELSFQPGEFRQAKVSYIYPTLDMKTRTLKVRIELENRDLKLRPGMFATVEIEAENRAAVLVIPTEAIIHSGTRQLVFVAMDLGRYSAREITAGLVGSGHVTEVSAGLVEGERVVTSGQFLLDSESQLQEAVQKMLAARLQYREVQPKVAERAEADSQPGKKAHQHDDESGGTYWTCGMHPQIVQEEPGTCPICGMDLTEKKK